MEDEADDDDDDDGGGGDQQRRRRRGTGLGCKGREGQKSQRILDLRKEVNRNWKKEKKEKEKEMEKEEGTLFSLRLEGLNEPNENPLEIRERLGIEEKKNT